MNRQSGADGLFDLFALAMRVRWSHEMDPLIPLIHPYGFGNEGAILMIWGLNIDIISRTTRRERPSRVCV